MPFQFFSPAKKLTITHGDLPHWEQEGSTYFITWRTIDSIPPEIWQRWNNERDTWLRNHGIDPSSPDWCHALEELPEPQRIDFRRFSRTLETELDACHGTCPLRDPNLARIVQDSLHFRDGTAYHLGDYVIMPNHVHLIVGGLPRGAMLKQVASWKKWTALEINRQLNRQGRFWQDESFDHLIRNKASHTKLCRYIAENPIRARLNPGEFIHHRSPPQSGPLSPLSGTQSETSHSQLPDTQSPHPTLSDSPSHPARSAQRTERATSQTASAMKHVLLLSLLLCTAHAQQSALKPATGKRVALVIGNDRYSTSPLENCVGDAAAIARLLREQLSFDVVLADKDSENLGRLAFTRRLQTFQAEAQNAEIALFYYAGHGMEDFDGRDNYLIPVDADLAEAAKDNAGLQAQGISLDLVLKSMRTATSGAKIILLDCCRERPADRAIRTRDGGGLTMPSDADLPQDTLIMLAAAPARTASDGTSDHGPFTAALLKHLPTPDTALHQTFRTVRNEVLLSTNQQQKPWLKLDGAGDFFYEHALAAKTPGSQSSPPPPTMPSAPAKANHPPSSLDGGKVGQTVDIMLPGKVVLQLCFCPAGTFKMGDLTIEAKHSKSEKPTKVTLTRPFWMARTELTQAAWEALMEQNPSRHYGPDLPVENVAAKEADAFIIKLNEKVPLQGWQWALPTEAQWEHACRAGTTTPFHFGSVFNGKEANCNGNGPYGTQEKGVYIGKTVRVGTYPPNAWGLHDMHGNVREWCLGVFRQNQELPGGNDPLETNGNSRALRGGSWTTPARECYAGKRSGSSTWSGDGLTGFRPIIVPAESPQ